MTQPRIVTTNTELDSLIRALTTSDYIAVDTEFLREKTYHAQLCLIQLATDDVVAAVDPLAKGLDLTPLLALLLEPQRLKVFHAGKQDLEIFFQLTGNVLEPFFDTQIAAMALGLGHPIGFSNLVQHLIGKNLSKGQQMTNWERRPLTEAQLGYALDDVIYLRPVFKQIRQQLEQKGRMEWLQEEESRLKASIINLPAEDKLWKHIRIRDKSARTLTALKELALWRDSIARKVDRPRAMVLRDEVMATLAHARPMTTDELANLRGLPHEVTGKYAAELLNLFATVNAMPKEALVKPVHKSPSDEVDSTVSSLAALLLRHIADKANVTANLIASTDELEAFLQGQSSPLASGWRYDLVGKELDKLRQGKIALTLKEGKVLFLDL
jgi:ribonuclease D